MVSYTAPTEYVFARILDIIALCPSKRGGFDAKPGVEVMVGS